MKVFFTHDKLETDSRPIVLTIGKFDGMHLGHSALLKCAKEYAKKLDGRLWVLTFINHPQEFFSAGRTFPKLCGLDHRLKLLEEMGVDYTVLIKFTQKFANQTAEQFIQSLHDKIKFKALILGHDASIGKDRQGDSILMHKLANQFGFFLEYVPAFEYEGCVVSSTLVKQAIVEGDLQKTKKLLGRCYSIWLPEGLRKDNGSYRPSAESMLNLCLPPYGKYFAKLKLAKIPSIQAEVLLKENGGQPCLKVFPKKLIDERKPIEIIFTD